MLFIFLHYNSLETLDFQGKRYGQAEAELDQAQIQVELLNSSGNFYGRMPPELKMNKSKYVRESIEDGVLIMICN